MESDSLSADVSLQRSARQPLIIQLLGVAGRTDCEPSFKTISSRPGVSESSDETAFLLDQLGMK